MTTTSDSHDAPLTGDDRLIDALLREHARAGNRADAAFLSRLDAALDAFLDDRGLGALGGVLHPVAEVLDHAADDLPHLLVVVHDPLGHGLETALAALDEARDELQEIVAFLA